MGGGGCREGRGKEESKKGKDEGKGREEGGERARQETGKGRMCSHSCWLQVLGPDYVLFLEIFSSLSLCACSYLHACVPYTADLSLSYRTRTLACRAPLHTQRCV